MGAKKLVSLVSVAVAFLVGVALGYLRGFEEGYNLSVGTYGYEADDYEQHHHDERHDQHQEE